MVREKTRDKQISEASYNYSKTLNKKGVFDYEDLKCAFGEGAMWVDANPKSPWISVEDDLPCNHQELMKNEYFTVRVFVFTVNKDIRTDSMVKESSGWKWVNAEFNYRYWMTMPELPKE